MYTCSSLVRIPRRGHSFLTARDLIVMCSRLVNPGILPSISQLSSSSASSCRIPEARRTDSVLISWLLDMALGFVMRGGEGSHLMGNQDGEQGKYSYLDQTGPTGQGGPRPRHQSVHTLYTGASMGIIKSINGFVFKEAFRLPGSCLIIIRVIWALQPLMKATSTLSGQSMSSFNPACRPTLDRPFIPLPTLYPTAADTQHQQLVLRSWLNKELRRSSYITNEFIY